jgi:NitT/TauT family transport system substrate-binding protein
MSFRFWNAAFAATLVLASASARVEAQEKQVVRYQEYPANLLHLSNWVMRDKGFCAKQGLDCRAIMLGSGPLALQAAAAGSVDLIVSSADVMMQAAARGNDMMILGTHISSSIYSLLASAEMAQAAGGQDYPANMKVLVDKRIGVTARGAATEMVTKALFAGAGLDTNKVSFVAVGGPGTAYAALAAKQVDAVLSWDPLPAICDATKICTTFVAMNKGKGPANLQAMNGGFVVWQARREYVQKNAAVIDGFLRAHAEAVNWLREPKNFAEAREIAAKGFKLGDVPDREKVFDVVVQRMIDTYGTTLDRKAVDGFNAFLIDNKVIDKPLDVSALVYKNAP